MPNAFPLLITHGWPGSFVEFTKIIGPLTDPVAHGGRAEEPSTSSCPSIPGFAFSDQPREPGYDPARIAAIEAKLMARLGYQRYGAQGGDWGSIISTQVALERSRARGRAAYQHVPRRGAAGVDPNAGLTEAERERVKQRQVFQAEETGYQQIQGTKPQTLGIALNDSPVGLAAWIVEKFRTWCDCDGDPEKVFTKDELLTNITMYWVTQTAGLVSAHLLREPPSAARRHRRRDASRCRRRARTSRRRSSGRHGGGSRRVTTSRGGRPCPAAATSPHSNSRSCSWTTCGRSSAACDSWWLRAAESRATLLGRLYGVDMKNIRRLAWGVLVVATANLLQGQSQAPSGTPPQGNVLGGVPNSQSQRPESPPSFSYQGGVDITSKIPPGALVMDVVFDAMPFLAPPPAGMSEMEFLTREYDAAALVQVTSVVGKFSPAKDWIFSDVEADVVEVLKPAAKGQLIAGQRRLTFRASGGVVRYGSTSINATSHVFDRVGAGGTYLVFLFTDDDGTLRTAPGSQFALIDSKLHRLEHGGDRDSAVVEGSADHHLAVVRAARNLPRAYPR